MNKLQCNKKNTWLKMGAYPILCLLLLFSVVGAGIAGTTLADEESISPNPYVVRTFIDEQGREIAEEIFPARPPEIKVAAVNVPEPDPFMGTNTIPNVPAFDWCYGCSATSAAMMFGYYDRTGYPNMYTGPTNGGVCPMDNSSWGPSINLSDGECPLSATHLGKDGLAVRGHVDDYWITINNPGPDPWIGSWTEHTHADCTADYMGTSQSSYGNLDGSTTFYMWGSGAPMEDYIGCEPGERDGCHGIRLFAESRGYTVNTNYYQKIQGQGTNPALGFTWDNYKTQIDAGRPVMIQVYGHSMLGIGYNDEGNLVYLHDTWDYATHSMTWGGSYSGRQHTGVTVLELDPLGSVPDAPGSFTATTFSTSQIDLSWTPGALAEKTMIRRSNSSYPTAPLSGDQVYFDTGTAISDTGLTPGTPYYYSAWSWLQGSDIWSASYVTAQATTTADPPDISVTPTSFEKTMPPNTSQSYPLSIGNTGGSTLTYDITDVDTTGVTAPAPAVDGMPSSLLEHEAGALPEGIIQSPPTSEPTSPQGTFGAGYDDALKYDDGTAELGIAPNIIGRRFAVRFTPLSYPASLETAWIHFRDGWPDGDHEQFYVEVWDDSGAAGAPGTLLDTTTTTATGWGWCSVDISGMGISIPSGDFYIAYRPTTTYPNCEGLSGDTASPDGRSWDQIGETWELKTAALSTSPGSDTVTPSGLKDITIPPHDYMIRCEVDTAIGCTWLNESPDSGTVAPSGTQDVTVSFDTNGLALGDYTANIVIANNDPAPGENPTIVPVSLQVILFIPGDANGDGLLNALDITTVEMVVGGILAATPGADANGDGFLNALDITTTEMIVGGVL